MSVTPTGRTWNAFRTVDHGTELTNLVQLALKLQPAPVRRQLPTQAGIQRHPQPPGQWLRRRADDHDQAPDVDHHPHFHHHHHQGGGRRSKRWIVFRAVGAMWWEWVERSDVLRRRHHLPEAERLLLPVLVVMRSLGRAMSMMNGLGRCVWGRRQLSVHVATRTPTCQTPRVSVKGATWSFGDSRRPVHSTWSRYGGAPGWRWSTRLHPSSGSLCLRRREAVSASYRSAVPRPGLQTADHVMRWMWTCSRMRRMWTCSRMRRMRR